MHSCPEERQWTLHSPAWSIRRFSITDVKPTFCRTGSIWSHWVITRGLVVQRLQWLDAWVLVFGSVSHTAIHFAHIWYMNWTLPVIRKSKDYVYGIWVYKALGIWKGYYRVNQSLVSYVKPWTEARNNEYMKYHSKLTYQLSFWNVSRKVDYHAGGKWFIHGPKRRKENQLLSLKHPCWLSLV